MLRQGEAWHPLLDLGWTANGSGEGHLLADCQNVMDQQSSLDHSETSANKVCYSVTKGNSASFCKWRVQLWLAKLEAAGNYCLSVHDSGVDLSNRK